MTKKEATYGMWNPMARGVTHVAIQTNTTPHSVFRAYFSRQYIPELGCNILMMPLAAALKEYEFRKEE